MYFIANKRFFEFPVIYFQIAKNSCQVKRGEISAHEASKKFNIPRTTILYKGSRRFIAKIYKVLKGRLYGEFIGEFIRPTTSRENNGFVYRYPNVKDRAKVNFDQIKKILPSPEVYGRGLFKFCVNSKNL